LLLNSKTWQQITTLIMQSAKPTLLAVLAAVCTTGLHNIIWQMQGFDKPRLPDLVLFVPSLSKQSTHASRLLEQIGRAKRRSGHCVPYSFSKSYWLRCHTQRHAMHNSQEHDLLLYSNIILFKSLQASAEYSKYILYLIYFPIPFRNVMCFVLLLLFYLYL
jgi:hypothetical protein